MIVVTGVGAKILVAWLDVVLGIEASRELFAEGEIGQNWLQAAGLR